MFARTVASGAILIVAAVAWSRGATTLPSASGARTLAPGVPHVIPVQGRIGACDLDCAADDQYDLIVSSLGDAGRTYRVNLRAAPIEGVERPPARWEARSIGKPYEFVGTKTPMSADSPDGGRNSTAEIERPDSAPATQRSFFLHVADTSLEDPGGYVAVSTRLVDEGHQVRIYLDRQVETGDLPQNLISNLRQCLDDLVLPFCGRLIGPVRDVDDDGKLAVVLTPWLGRLQGGRSQAQGFVRSADFSHALPAPFSNQADVLYLNTHLPQGAALETLLVHEVTHAASISLREPADERPSAFPPEHDWLSEGIAHVAENLYGGDWSNLGDRVERFLEDPACCPLAVRDYYRAGLWRDPGCRGATFLFLRWCVDACGPDLLRRLVQSPTTGVDNVEFCSGTRFAALYRQFTLALNAGHLASLDLHDQLGACRLDGVRRLSWRFDKPAPEISLGGTATAFVRIDSPPAAGPRRLVIDSDAGAALQLTVIRRRRSSANATAPFPAGRADTALRAGRRD
ncbi:MAG: hypothetical protein ACT4QC_07335 [Planctomycetaceae bacterium]